MSDTYSRKVDPIKYYKGQLFKKSPFRCSVCLDYFEIFGRTNKAVDNIENLPDTLAPGIPIPSSNTSTYQINDDLYLIFIGGSAMYNSLFSVVMHGETVGTLQAHPRKPIGVVNPNSVQFKLSNHLLYSVDWLETVFSITSALKIEILNVTRLDVAIDGANHVNDFVNFYLKQSVDNKHFLMKGRADLRPIKFDRVTMNFGGFQIGSNHSEKRLAIYNKTREIEVSNKKYIQRFWELSGVDTSKDVYRVELRMSSKGVKQIKGFDLNQLTDPVYLASIFQTQITNFFQFVVNDNQNISRCTPIDLINFCSLGGVLLPKTKKVTIDDRYKAKLAIHLGCRDILSKRLDVDYHSTIFSSIALYIVTYDLLDWFKLKLPAWLELYQRPFHTSNIGFKSIESNTFYSRLSL